MKAVDAINATATVLSRMNVADRAAVARVLTMPGKIESITQDAIYDDVKAIATRSVNGQVKTREVMGAVDDLLDAMKSASERTSP